MVGLVESSPPFISSNVSQAKIQLRIQSANTKSGGMHEQTSRRRLSISQPRLRQYGGIPFARLSQRRTSTSNVSPTRILLRIQSANTKSGGMHEQKHRHRLPISQSRLRRYDGALQSARLSQRRILSHGTLGSRVTYEARSSGLPFIVWTDLLLQKFE